MPRFGGPATMMRLPAQDTAEGLDACLSSASRWTSAPRTGRARGLGKPRQIRDESRMLRPYNMATGAAPFEQPAGGRYRRRADQHLRSEEVGRHHHRLYDGILGHGAIPLTLGGDHTLTWPILRAMKKKHGPVALIHVDAHADINEAMFGETVAHGCPFRRAWEDGCLINDRVFQIGLRGTGYSPEDFDWGRQQGWTVIQAEACWYRSLAPLMERVRAT
jgi:guanidinobutyrase